MKHRFIVENETCFITLLTSTDQCRVGLVVQGANQMEEFCQAAIDAYEQLMKNKGGKKHVSQK